MIILVPVNSSAVNCDSDCKEKLVRTYFDHLEVVYREGSIVEDIDGLFQVFHPDVKYEHLEYQADFDFETWKEAFTSNLRHGSYNKGPNDSIRITKNHQR